MKTKLKYWRNKRVLSISMLAKRADVAPATIVNIEKQKHVPNPETLHRIANALSISIDELVVNDEEKPTLATAS